VRNHLSAPTALFHLNFQNYEPKTENFNYTCLIFNVSESGVWDSVGMWWELFLDRERELVLTNAPAYASERQG
jgi:hypothetical protein